MIDVFVKFKSMVGRQSCHEINVLRNDGESEYVSSEFDALCEKGGIVHDVVTPYAPNKIGVHR